MAEDDSRKVTFYLLGTKDANIRERASHDGRRLLCNMGTADSMRKQLNIVTSSRVGIKSYLILELELKAVILHRSLRDASIKTPATTQL